jgi:hypothetical protein
MQERPSAENPKWKHSAVAYGFGAIVAGLLIVTLLEILHPSGDKAPVVFTPDPKPTTQQRASIVNNDLGRTTIERNDKEEIASIKIDTISKDQRQALRAMLVHLEVSDLTAQRACSLTLKFGGWSDRGEILNCAGARIGSLNSDAIGYMRDKISDALGGNTEK